MEFIYPFFNKITHTIKIDNPINTLEYPKQNNVVGGRYSLQKNIPVVIIRYGLGYNCEWSIVKVIDESYKNEQFYNKEFYIRTNDLLQIDSNKKYMTIHNSRDNWIDFEAPEIMEETREPYLPYSDKRNGLYSVKIELEYEKFIDNMFFVNSMMKAYREGIRVLLQSRGIRSDDGYIDYLLNTYYNFAYVNKSRDILSVRPCVPVRFTVSIPLVFIGTLVGETLLEQDTGRAVDFSKATKLITVSKQELVSNAEKIINSLLARMTQIEDLTKPLKFLDNYLVNYEISRVNKFVSTFYELLIKADLPPTNNILQQYDIGLTDDLDIVYIKVFQNREEYLISTALLEQYKFSSDSFTSKRVLNYFINVGNMFKDSYNENISVIEFINTYVAYPTPKLNDSIQISPETKIPADQAKEFNDFFKKQQECSTVTLKDLINSDPLYHLFVASTRNKVETQDPTYKEVMEEAIKVAKVGQEEEVTRDKDETGWFATFGYSALSGVTGRIGNYETLGAPETTTSGKKIGGTRQFIIICLQILERINIVRAVIDYYICILMQGDASDKEMAENIKKYLSPQMIAYLLQIFTNDINWQDAMYKIINGLDFDVDLFCIKNKDVAYFIKALMSGNLYVPGSEEGAKSDQFQIFDFSNGLFSTNLVDPVKQKIKEFRNIRKSNSQKNNKVYKRMMGDIISNIFSTLASRLMQYLQLFLELPCANDEFSPRGENPLNSYATKNNTYSDNLFNIDNGNIRNANAASSAIPIRYDIDPEGSLDLMKKLFEDLSCVLTPIEICDAMEGNISDEAMMLVRGVIRRNYLPDLEELLSESNIRLLFDSLSKTVDPKVCKNIRNSVIDSIKKLTNTLSNDPNTINALAIECNPTIAIPRAEILKDKGDNNVIQQIKSKNKRLSDKINKMAGEDLKKPLDISLFCTENGEINPNIDQNFRNNIRNLIDSFKLKFNEDATQAAENFISLKQKEVRLSAGSNANNVSGEATTNIEYKISYEDFKRNTVMLTDENEQNRLTNIIKILNSNNNMYKTSNRIKMELTLEDIRSRVASLISVDSINPDSKECFNESQKLDLEKLKILVNKVPIFHANQQYVLGADPIFSKDPVNYWINKSKGGTSTTDKHKLCRYIFGIDDDGGDFYKELENIFYSYQKDFTSIIDTQQYKTLYDLWVKRLNLDKSELNSNIVARSIKNIIIENSNTYTGTRYEGSDVSIAEELFSYYIKNNIIPSWNMRVLLDDFKGIFWEQYSFISTPTKSERGVIKEINRDIRMLIRDSGYVIFYSYDGDNNGNKEQDKLSLSLLYVDNKYNTLTTWIYEEFDCKEEFERGAFEFDTDVFDEGYADDFSNGNSRALKEMPQLHAWYNVDTFSPDEYLGSFNYGDNIFKAYNPLTSTPVFKDIKSGFDSFFPKLQKFFEDKEKIEKQIEALSGLLKYNNFPIFDIITTTDSDELTVGGAKISLLLNTPKEVSISINQRDNTFTEAIQTYDSKEIYSELLVEKEQPANILEIKKKIDLYEASSNFKNLLLYLRDNSTEQSVEQSIKGSKLSMYNGSQDEILDDTEEINNIKENYIKALSNEFIASMFDTSVGFLNLSNLKTDINLKNPSIIFDLEKGLNYDKNKIGMSGGSSDPEEIKKMYEEMTSTMVESNMYASMVKKFSLNLLQSLQEEVCQYFPHYYNDKSWIGDFDAELKAKICDGAPSAFPEAAIKIILKLLMRTYIAEIMFRGIHKFTYYKEEDIQDLIKDVNFKTIIRNQFFKELVDMGGESLKTMILKHLEDYYNELESNSNSSNLLEKLDSKYIERIDQENKFINYFITKEIIYFFAIIKKIIKDMRIDTRAENKIFIDSLNKSSRFVNIYDAGNNVDNIQNLIKFSDRASFVEQSINVPSELIGKAKDLVKISYPNVVDITRIDNENKIKYSKISLIVPYVDRLDGQTKYLEMWNKSIFYSVSEDLLEYLLKSEEVKALIEYGGLRLFSLSGLEYIFNSVGYNDKTSNNFKETKIDLIKNLIGRTKSLIDNLSDENKATSLNDIYNEVIRQPAFKDVDPVLVKSILNKASYAKEPSLLIKKEQRKIEFDGGWKLVKNLAISSAHIAKISLETNDPMARKSKIISNMFTYGFRVPWFLSRNDEERKIDIAKAGYNWSVVLTRLYTGRSFAPDAAYAVIPPYFFTPSTVLWISLDIAEELLDIEEFEKKRVELRKYRSENVEKCQEDPSVEDKIKESLKCDLAKEQEIEMNYKKLEKETIYYLEENK